MDNLYEDKTFENEDYSEKKMPAGEYDNCAFVNCNFTKADLSNINFIDSSFKGCNLSLAVVKNTGIKSIQFYNCRITGVDFSASNDFLFAATFENCQLDYSSFHQKKMKKTLFADCSLKEVDFAETDLSSVVFKNCDLVGTVFVDTMLEKADFRTARNYSFDPERNKIKKAKFSLPEVTGLLAKYNIEID